MPMLCPISLSRKGIEFWIAIPGYDGYLVSNLGRVKGPNRILNVNGRKSGGYARAALYSDGVSKNESVHVLMLLAFVGPRPLGCVARHLDDDNSRNLLFNLAWGTRSDNEQDKLRNGKSNPARGERQAQSKLKEYQILEIRRASAQQTQASLAKKYGVAQRTIGRVLNRETWND